nr:hypothetical protein [Gammaproteobacteria bacterium]
NGEAGMPGVLVSLMSCEGVQLASVFTDNGGAYAFNDLAAGSYRIKFVAPAGADISPPRKGTTRGGDSNPDPATGMTECKPLSTGQTRLGIDAGIMR